MEKMYTAVATSVGGRSGSVKSSDGVLNLEVRPPKEMGGPGGNYTNPEQLFAAGYSACFGSAVSIGTKEGGGFQLAVEMDVHIKGISQQEAEELVKEAHQVCPYSNATRNNIEVTLKVTTENK